MTELASGARPPGAPSAQPGRESWLGLLEELFDDETTERLERIGIGAGWDVLEVGAGRGSIAAWLARRVAPSGRVIATDLDTHLLEQRGATGFDVIRHDVLVDDFPAGSFDLVHCRSLLLLLPDPPLALRRMARWLRPGGVLLVEEPWIEAATLSPDPLTARAVGALEVGAPHVDGGFARRLPMALRELGLERVEGEGRITFFEGGSSAAGFFRAALEGYLDRLIQTGICEPGDRERLRARYEDRGWLDCGWPRIAAWGRTPAHEPNQRPAGRSRASARLSGDGAGVDRSISRSTALFKRLSRAFSRAAR